MESVAPPQPRHVVVGGVGFTVAPAPAPAEASTPRTRAARQDYNAASAHIAQALNRSKAAAPAPQAQQASAPAPAPATVVPEKKTRVVTNSAAVGRTFARQKSENENFSHELTPDTLSNVEQHIDERIRTGCLAIIALAVVFAVLDYLKEVLRPFFVALAFKYLLTPVIDFLSCRGASSDSRPNSLTHRLKCTFRLPRPFAIAFAFFFAFWVLLFLGGLVARSISIFTSNSERYMQRLEYLVTTLVEWRIDNLAFIAPDATKESVALDMQNLIQSLNIPGLITGLLGSAAHVAEDFIYVLLFLVFMLTSHGGGHGGEDDDDDDDDDDPAFNLAARIDEQVFTYIRGKAIIAALVAVSASTFYIYVGLETWLVFAVLTFFLNFIPSVGLFIAICLPMPLVVLEPSFSGWDVAAAFLGPLTTATFAKDVLEPWLIGAATSLHPVVMLLSIMLFGTIWGMVGMIMAVPLTAIMRIVLKNIEHPLSRYIADVLGGTRTRFKNKNKSAYLLIPARAAAAKPPSLMV